MSPIEKSFIHVNGSRRTMNPISSTSAVDVPAITNDDVTLRPLAYADKVNRSAQAAASPTTMTRYRLLVVKAIGEPVAFIVIVNARFARKATPVMIVAPNAG